MTSASQIAAGYLLGLLLFSFVEYGMHRFAFHERPGRNWGSRQHLRHHAYRDLVMSGVWVTWSLTIVISLLVLRPVGTALVSPAFGWGFGIGGAWGFFTYEYLHTVTHWRAPRTAYGRWVRRHHFHHHFTNPLSNHGFTTPLWDIALGTYTRVDRVAVPRRMAPRWMIDDRGELLPGVSGTYELRGRAAPAREGAAGELELDPRDLADAYANVAPR